MDHNGQRGSSTPSAMLATLLSRRAKLQEELGNIERQVYDMETSYLQDPGQCGNVLKARSGPGSSSLKTGYSHYLRSLLQWLKRLPLATARDGEPVICRGKPKKGRGREAKKMRHFSEPDYDYDDDPDVTL
ncbi:hypothetical protein ERO13_D07G218900v2 [Gossypium hirsutum]|uniref:Uncharacterized protein isoform X2 n=4 Tax=Gossypium TaxID=3633 RepID=A0A1U8PFH8_GOSHI|nr:uncharacterized protein LOC107958653 isoform X2 [Gossypium hirsutum]KAB2022860.1 hypothetical protein ES319_D07G242000v1 [Gossypium barbadense]KAG4139829.1 hypothetical protein ERO13_D07G218900v2 [Gossypium hirsutum]TYG62782.1 hypothetical protein ES288_D07G259900v1 [Gossypium darwinii]TYH64300.1 hypothetical protein ES332_D07G257900v1 [Gossypium tomentosum]